MNKKIFAFIFARGGSRGIKNKNLIKFNGKPLIYYSIQIAKKMKLFKQVYVCTDDNQIAKYAKKFKVNIIKRPKSLCSDDALFEDALVHGYETALKRINYKIYIYINDFSFCKSRIKFKKKKNNY